MSAPLKTYRPEIDGLRAIAVMGVLLFHFDLGFPGGFVGVDVFFVISGYLITGILLRQLEGERFSLSDFWARRVRRIAPAAVVMALGTVAMGWYVLESGDFRELARSLMAHVFFASNCYFSRDQGYFEESGGRGALDAYLVALGGGTVLLYLPTPAAVSVEKMGFTIRGDSCEFRCNFSRMECVAGEYRS